jgi:predicted permease
MGTIIQDLRYGLRMLLRRPGFTVVVVLTLAVGIGANTAIFSVVNAVLLRELPYHDPSKLVTVLHDGSSPVAPANFLDWKQQNQSFESMAAAQVWGPNLTGQDRPEAIKAMQTTADLFGLLGVSPALGRAFNADEDKPGNERVVVLSDRLWQRRFGADKNIIGRQITLDGNGYTIIGVMPPDFQFAPFWATHAEMWAPLNLAARLNDRVGQSLRVFARLKPGITSVSAQAEMETISRRIEQQYPESNKGLTVSVDSLHEKAVGTTRPALLILLGAVGFVLLIACANVANLMLARSAARKREMAVRTALGAGRGRIVRQMLTESMMLSVLGGGLGLLAASWGIQALLAVAPAGLPQTQKIGLDFSVLAFCMSLSIITGLLFGLAPALQTSKVNLNDSLKEGGRSSTEGNRQHLFRSLLVVSEVALALMLLIGGGLLFRSFLRLRAVDPGFNADKLLTMELSFNGSAESTDSKRIAFLNELTERVQALPGVRSTSAINHLPVGGDVWSLGYIVEGRPLPGPGETPHAVYRVSRPDYFKTMGATLLRGRDFTARDNEAGSGVVIINESLARAAWPTEDPIGKRISLPDDNNIPREVVGIIKDAKQHDWTAQPSPEMYLPQSQSTGVKNMTVVVRTASDPLRMATAIQSEVWAIDKNLPLSQVRSMDQVVSEAIGPQRFNMFLLGLFASIAVILAVVGIYGVLSYSVAQRTHEIGIRMALGARQKDVLGLVVRQGMLLSFIGVGIGLVGAFGLMRLMESLLFEVSATDPQTFAVIAALLSIVSLLACYIPARRAANVDPMVALRNE